MSQWSFLSLLQILAAIQNCGLETKTFDAVDQAHVICMIRAPPDVLGNFAELIGFHMKVWGQSPSFLLPPSSFLLSPFSFLLPMRHTPRLQL